MSPADLLVSAALFVAFLPYVHRTSHIPLAVTLGALSSGALLAKKRFPVLTLAVCLLLTGILTALVRFAFPMTPVTFIALYAVGRYRAHGVTLAVAICTIVAGFLTSWVWESIPDYELHNISQLGWVIFAVLAGAWVRDQRAHLAGAEQRAARAEHEREEEARRRVAEERVRIARELHDIVGHALMSINVLSTVSLRIVERDPATGRDALRTVSEISGSALQEIRSTLSLLREGAQPLKRPGRGIDDLPQMIEQARRSGLPVTLTMTGVRPGIPAIIGYTVYRMVQESLTNITRHAVDVTTVTVAVICADDHLEVAVTNDGAVARDTAGTGTGIQGMRERLSATGGSLDITAPAEGGFRVRARLPLKEVPR